MEDKEEPSKEPEKKSETGKRSESLSQILKESTADAWNLTAKASEESEKQDSSNSRQVVDGSLLGTCLVFFAAMLSVQQLDTPLTVATVAFAIAIPPLVWGFLSASYRITEKLKEVPGWRILAALQIGGWVIEVFGLVAVIIGLCGVILHLSHPAFTAFIWAIIVTAILLVVGPVVGAIFYFWRKEKREQKAKQKAQSASSPIQPQPALIVPETQLQTARTTAVDQHQHQTKTDNQQVLPEER